MIDKNIFKTIYKQDLSFPPGLSCLIVDAIKKIAIEKKVKLKPFPNIASKYLGLTKIPIRAKGRHKNIENFIYAIKDLHDSCRP